MANLKVAYDERRRWAVLSTDAPNRGWSRILNACEGHTDQVEILSRTKVSLPWWRFLSSRADIAYFVDKYNVSLEYSPKAIELLEKANANVSAFEKCRDRKPRTRNTLEKELKQLGFSRRLTSEQIRNVSKISVFDAAATFSVPGAGKTTEALATYFLRRSKETRLLVIAPKNAFASWDQQLTLCVPICGLHFERLVGGEKKIIEKLKSDPTLMIITYHQLHVVQESLTSHLSKIEFFLFVDESHRIKGGALRQTARAVLSLGHLPKYKLVMSGTPMPNAMSDLVPQFDFLFPEIVVDEETVADLIQPFFVRTTKGELGLPPLQRLEVAVPMSPAQWRLYHLMRSEAARQADEILKTGDRLQFRAMGKSVIRLLQVASNPALLARSYENHSGLLGEVLAEGGSPKLEIACGRARELAESGQKVVIWSTFVDNVELIARRLQDLGADFIHGKVDAGSEEEEDTREGKIRRFHEDPEAFVLVANPAACGEGISLHEVCHHAIYVDRNYNAAQYLQSEDRIHRLGLSKGQLTSIEILYCTDSVDESVSLRLKEKVRKMGVVLNDSGLNIDPVSFDPTEIGNDEAMDNKDITDFIRHLKTEVDD